jgi:hypothetical protein
MAGPARSAECRYPPLSWCEQQSPAARWGTIDENANLEAKMIESSWVGLTTRERSILLDALVALREAGRASTAKIDALTVKLVHSDAHPRITVGVHGGQVQWVSGNPFPIRVLDYDNDYCDAPHVDEQGRKCRCSIEPADKRRSRPQHLA